jgi:hypothetical protein
MNDVIGESLCFGFSDQAERARWHMADLPWDRLDPRRAPEPLRALVREAAFSELTTTSATKRFLDEFSDDTDFTQWVSVWFFEETRHPQVLLRWLHGLGVTVDEQFLRRGRATAPFMKSKFGTLVANVISELVASAAYAGIHATIDEPVLAAITRNLAGDEARHAASFFAYAQRYLARSREPDADRRDALKVVYLWFQDTVRHPVSEFVAKNGATPGMNVDELRGRVLQVIGALVGVPLDAQTDLRALLAKGAV